MSSDIVWVTSACLGARNDRPWIYYLHPLQDQVEVLTTSEIDFLVWTWPRSVRGVSVVAPKERIRTFDPDSIARALWDKDSWDGQLPSLHINPKAIEARNPSLFDIWLAKLPLVLKSMEETGAEVGMWVDCAHAVSWDCKHAYDRYTSQLITRWNLKAGLPTIVQAARDHGVVLCGEMPAVRPLPIEHVVKEKYCNGSLFAIHKTYGQDVVAAVQKAWKEIREAGKIHTDEPWFALAAAERDWPMWPYARWQEVLCGRVS